MKKGVKSLPDVDVVLLMANSASVRRLSKPFLRRRGRWRRRQRVADGAFYPLHLGDGVLAVGRADDEARAHALDQGAEHLS